MKRKELLLVLLLTALLLTLAGCGSSDPYTEGLEFKKLSKIGSLLVKEHCSEMMDDYAVTGYTGSEKDVVIPAQYRGKPVVAMLGTFQGNKDIVSVSIPQSVAVISSAFASCTGLREITIPGSVVYIGNHTFAYCTSLTEVTIPDSVTAIGTWAFTGCRSLASVTLGSGVTEIGKWAFDNCALTEVVIPENLTSYEFAFDSEVILGTKAHYYQLSLPTEEVLAQAEQHLGENLSDARLFFQFSPEERSDIGDRLTGPFVCLDNFWRPDILSSEYNADALSGRPGMVSLDLDGVPKEYLDAMLTKEKIAAVQNGDAKIVYALIECTGYTISEYMIGPNLYHEMYRISFWDLENNELLGWDYWTTGYAPGAYSSDETVYFHDMNKNKVCLESDGSSEYGAPNLTVGAARFYTCGGGLLHLNNC